MKKAWFLLVMLLLTFSCNDDGINPDDVIIFGGITERDEFGVVKSIDSTDWQLMDEWNDKEEALFDEAFEYNCNNAAFDYSVITYPNPCQDMVTLRISKPGDARFSFCIVDEDYNVLFSRDTMNTNSIFLNLENFSLPGDTVRVYYKFFKQDCELKGHGDVAINL